MKRTQAMRRKLRSRAGESLTEVLAALLVSALALTMLAAMISSSGKMIQKSEDKMEDYIAADRALVQKEGGTSDTVTASFSVDGNPMKLSDENEESFFKVTCFQNTEFGGDGIISYKVTENAG